MAGDPGAVFSAAQTAMERGDWHAFFACLDPRDLTLVAGHGLRLVASSEPGERAEVRALADRRGVTAALLDAVADAVDAVDASAPLVVAAQGAAQLEASLRHRDLVRTLDAAVTAAARGATDLAALTADLEILRRAHHGGGGVSSSLFVGETLSDVRIDARRAVGTRRLPGGHAEPVVFALTRRGWVIRLFGRPPRPAR